MIVSPLAAQSDPSLPVVELSGAYSVNSDFIANRNVIVVVDQKVSPFFGVAGGALFTRANIPPGDTSTVNFTPQIDLGFHLFTRQSRALTFEMDIVHHSNASIGNQNPGYNASVFFTLGYVWYKTRK